MSSTGPIFGNPNNYFSIFNQSFGKEDKSWLNNSFGDTSWLNNSLCLPPEQRYQSLNEMVTKIVDDEAQKSLMASGNSLNLSHSFAQSKHQTPPNQVFYISTSPQRAHFFRQDSNLSVNSESLYQPPIDVMQAIQISPGLYNPMAIAFPPSYSHQLSNLSIDQQNYLLQQQNALVNTMAFQEIGKIYNPYVYPSFVSRNQELEKKQPNQQNFRNNHRRTGPANELHIRLEECLYQLKCLENERRKVETELSYINLQMKKFNSSVPRLSANPSRVDRLVNESLKEHSRLFYLITKIDTLKNTIFYENILKSVHNWINGIKNVQEKRKNELMKNRQRNVESKNIDENDVIILAESIKELSLLTSKVRTSLWCALQISNVNYNLQPGESWFDSVNKTKEFIDKTFEIKTDLIF